MSAGIRSGVHWTRRSLEAKDHAQRLDQPGLGQARHADQQHVAAGQERDQGLIDDPLLAEDHPADAGPALAQAVADRSISSASASADGVGRTVGRSVTTGRSHFWNWRDIYHPEASRWMKAR